MILDFMEDLANTRVAVFSNDYNFLLIISYFSMKTCCGYLGVRTYVYREK